MPNPSRDSGRPVLAGPAHQSLQPQTAPNAVAAATHPPTGAAETRSADPRRENCSSPTALVPKPFHFTTLCASDPKSDRLLVHANGMRMLHSLGLAAGVKNAGAVVRR